MSPHHFPSHAWTPFCLASVLILSPAVAHAQTTEWIATVGDWSTGTNWSNGEPTAGVDAEVRQAGAPTVSMTGEVCRNLTTGIVAGSTLQVQFGGELDVVERLHIGAGALSTGSLLQFGGAVSADELVVGNPSAEGAYVMTGGTLDLGSAQIGTPGELSSGAFAMSVSNPVVTITGSLNIAVGGMFQCGGGTLTVGTTPPTDGMFLDGSFTLSDLPAVSTTGFTMSPSGLLTIFVGATGVSMITVNGTATLAGSLFVADLGASDDTYEVLRADLLGGTFEFVTLPPDWSWRVEGNSLLLTKGIVPVETSRWGQVKRRFGR